MPRSIRPRPSPGHPLADGPSVIRPPAGVAPRWRAGCRLGDPPVRYCAAVDVLRTYRALLGNGPLTRLLAGEFVSAIGDWLYLVALLILVYERPDASPVLLGVVGAARVLPYVFLSVPAGIVADRYDRRLVLLGTDLARGAIMLLMAALVAVDGPLLPIVGLAILATCFSAFFGPAIGAYLPRLVRDETELGPANSAWASLDSLAFAVGPAIGGAIILATGGLTLAFLLNAASFAVVAFVLWRLPSSSAHVRAGCRPRRGPAPAPGGTGPRRAAAPAAPDVLRPLAGLVVISAVGGFVFGGLGVLTVVIATDILREGAAGTGALNAAIGIGGLVGALAAGVLVLRRRLALPLIAGGLAMVIGIAALGLTSSLALAAVALAAACLGSSIVDIVSLTLLQRLVPDAARGRAIGVIETISIGAYAAGSLILPIAAAPLGLPLLLGGCAAACLAAIAGRRRHPGSRSRPRVDHLAGGRALRGPAGLRRPLAGAPGGRRHAPAAGARRGRDGGHPPGRRGRPPLLHRRTARATCRRRRPRAAPRSTSARWVRMSSSARSAS